MAGRETIKQINQYGELEDFLAKINVKLKPGKYRVSGDINVDEDGSMDELTAKNMRLYSLSQDEEEEPKKLFGEIIQPIIERRKYSKVYQVAVKEIQFSQWSYEGLWFRLVCNLYRNSNIIYRRASNNCLTLIHTKTELMNLTSASRKAFNNFYRELIERDYIRILEDHDLLGKIYTVNPYYARNGLGLVRSIYKLWQDIIEDLLIPTT